MNPETYLTPKANRPGAKKNRIDRTQKKRVAARMMGRVSRNSGAGHIPARSGHTKLRVGGKGDVSSKLLLTECKTTAKASISLKQEHLIKISREAKQEMKSPAMVLSFPVMPAGVDCDWAVVSLGFLTKIMDKAGLVVPDEFNRL